MNTQSSKHSKVLISYQGGSGGDMITSSLNDLTIAHHLKLAINNNDFNLKPFEPFYDLRTLTDIAESMPCRYLSTHELKLLYEYQGLVINLVVSDPKVRRTIVLRQMYLQTLKIQVDPDSIWFQIVRSYCNNGKYLKAAKYWLAQAESIWNSCMDLRLLTQHKHIQNISIDSLFTTDFVAEFVNQLGAPNMSRLQSNHAIWLDKNHQDKWCLDSTLESMSRKLEKMDWSQESGIIIFEKKKIGENHVH
jgi:hypothetical protein